MVEPGAVELAIEKVEGIPSVDAGTEDQGVGEIGADYASHSGENAFGVLVLCVGWKAHDFVFVFVFVCIHSQEDSNECI